MKLYKTSLNLKWTAVLITISILFQTRILPHILDCFSPKLTPVVTLLDGQVQGKVAYTQKGAEYWQFSSIPYAEPPLGKLKFQPPVPVKPWKGILKTIYPIPLCTQFESPARQRLLGQEDCLYLNVFTAPFSSKDRRPVIVTISGGGFFFGGAQHYMPGRFMNHKDIVMVFLNYRLGPQGFLNFAVTTTDKESLNLPRGNMGIKDQRLVLEWVQKNIAKFGGDENRISLYGQSAGGISANLLMLSNSTNKLFHRVIAHSGAALSGWSFARYPRRLANNLANKLGCSLEDKKELMNCLISADPHEMASYSISPINPTLEQDIFVPSIETVITEDTFLGEHPYELLRKGIAPDIPLMMGVNSGEGGLRLGRFERRPEYIQIIDENWESRMHGLIGAYDIPAKVVQDIRRFYFPPGNKTFTEDLQSFKDGLVKLISDTCVYESVHTVAKVHSRKNGSGPTYIFLYDYLLTRAPGILSFYKAVDVDVDIHAEDMLIFWELWPIIELTGLVHSKEDSQFSEALINTTLDFARGKEELLFRGVIWPTINAANQANQTFPYMFFNRTGYGEVVSEPFTDRMRFWESIGIRNYM